MELFLGVGLDVRRVVSVLDRSHPLAALLADVRKMDGVVENVHFPLPRGLGDRSMNVVAATRS